MSAGELEGAAARDPAPSPAPAGGAAGANAPATDREAPDGAPRTSRRWMLEALLTLGAVGGVVAYQQRHLLAGGGTPAPGLTLPALGGPPVSLAALRGKAVIVHFWATWCGVCRVQLPEVAAAARGLAADEALLTVVEDPEAVPAFAREHALPYPILHGAPEVLRAWGVSAFPTDYFLDRQGRIALSTMGFTSRLGYAARLAWAGRA